MDEALGSLLVGIIGVMFLVLFMFPKFDEWGCEEDFNVYDCQWVLKPKAEEGGL